MNLKLSPVVTEKSMRDAKEGVYTFYVDSGMTKYHIARLVGEIFKVDVTKVHTVNLKKNIRKDLRGRLITKDARKKAYVSLKKGQKIDIFESKKGKK